MAHLFQSGESVAASAFPELVTELARRAPEGMSSREALHWAGGLRIIDPHPVTRARLLEGLVFPGERVPSPHVAEIELLSRWIDPPEELSLVRDLEPDRSCPVLIDSGLWSIGAIAADWGFFLDHFVFGGLHLGWYTSVVPRDARWVLSTGIEEYVHVARPSFARIRVLTYAPRTEIKPGMIVPKPQCRITFDDGASWDSGQIRGTDPRGVAMVFLGFLAARTGRSPVEVDVLAPSPTAPRHDRRT